MTDDDIRRLRQIGRNDQIHAPALEALAPLWEAFKSGNTDRFESTVTDAVVASFRAGYEHAIDDVIALQEERRQRRARGYDTIDPTDGGRNDR